MVVFIMVFLFENFQWFFIWVVLLKESRVWVQDIEILAMIFKLQIIEFREIGIYFKRFSDFFVFQLVFVDWKKNIMIFIYVFVYFVNVEVKLWFKKYKLFKIFFQKYFVFYLQILFFCLEWEYYRFFFSLIFSYYLRFSLGRYFFWFGRLFILIILGWGR